MYLCLRFGSCLGLALGLVAAIPAALPAASAPDPVAGVPSATPYFMPESISEVMIAPNGQRIGYLVLKDDRSYAFALMETNGQPPRILLQPDGQNITHFWWKDDDLLLLLIQDLVTGNRAFATYDFKTTSYRQLSLLANTLQFVAPLHDNPDEMMFASVTMGTATDALLTGSPILSTDLVRINVRTGGSTPDIKDPEHVQKWFVNARGEVIAGWQEWEKEWALWWRKSPTDRWQATRMPKKQEYPEFIPLEVAPDGKRLFALDYRRSDGVDLVYYDPATGDREIVVGGSSSIPIHVDNWGFDETPGVVRYEGESLKEKYLNPAAEALQQNLQKTLPGLTVELGNFSRDDSRAVVLATGDRIAGEYLVVERATGQFVRIGPRRAQMTRERTASRRFFEFKASDGQRITGVVTLPNNSPKAPLVLFLDSSVPSRVLTANPLVHYFASLGYAVAEVNYRGTDGFSSDFRAAGLFQQEKAISRDLSEAVTHLEAQGLADGSRVVIYCSGNRALQGFALAAQSKAIKAVIAVDPWTLIERADARVLEHSSRLEIDLVRLAGPNFAYQAHRKNADPSDNAVKAALPILAYYPDIAWAPTARGTGVKAPDSTFTSAIRKASKQTEIFKASEVMKELGYGNATEMVDWRVTGRGMEHAVAFLHKLGLP